MYEFLWLILLINLHQTTVSKIFWAQNVNSVYPSLILLWIFRIRILFFSSIFHLSFIWWSIEKIPRIVVTFSDFNHLRYILSVQLSWIQQALTSPDIFCFADYPCHTVVTEILKAPPEDDNREIATWYVSGGQWGVWYLVGMGGCCFSLFVRGGIFGLWFLSQ